MFERLKHFILESKRELSRVNWPSREETMRLTGVVIAISLAISIFLGAFDALFFIGVKYIAEFAPAPVTADFLPINGTSSVSSTVDNSGAINLAPLGSNAPVSPNAQ